MKLRRFPALLLGLALVVALVATLIRLNRSDWRPLPGGGEVFVYRVTYEKHAHVSFGGSPLVKVVRALPSGARQWVSGVAGDPPAEWWLPANEPSFAVWAVERLSSLQSPGLGRLLIVLPDGREMPGQAQGWIIGGKHRLRAFVFDPALRSLPRLHLRLFAKDRPEPIDFDIPNPVFESATAASTATPAL